MSSPIKHLQHSSRDSQLAEQASLDLKGALICLQTIAAILHVPISFEQLHHEHGADCTAPLPLILVRAARSLGLRAKASRLKPRHWASAPKPLIGITREGRCFILAKIQGGEALVQEGNAPPSLVTLEMLVERWDGDAVLITSRARIAGDERRFDWTWFIPAIVKYRRLFGEVLLASFFLQLLALATPLFFQVIIDKVLVHRGLTTLNVLALALVGIILIDVLLKGLRTYSFAHTAYRVDVELGTKLFRHLMALPVSYFETRQVGQTVARVHELENIRDFLTGSAMTLVLDILFVFVFFAVMWSYSPTLTGIVLATIPLYVLISLAITNPLRRRIEERFRQGAREYAFLVETVSSADMLKASAVEPQRRSKWEELLASYVGASFRVVSLGTVGTQTIDLIGKLTTVALIWWGAHLVVEGALTVGMLVAFNMLAAHVIDPILRMSQLWQDFQQFRISIDRLGDILNTEPEPHDEANQQSILSLRGHVHFHHVSYRYRPDLVDAVKEIDLDIPAGQVIGIVGKSGSGKSTLTKLIQRLYLPTNGRVLIDQQDIGLMNPAGLRRQVGVVLQENVLLNCSIRDNIALSDPSLSMDKVIKAAKLAGAHDFIMELPCGYSNVISERGASLSGGQRQRIAIARALIGDPRILIFDEATSALDYESERVIQDNMKAISKGRTVIIVAHRLSTVRQADRIVTMHEGRVVEDGSHDELLEKGGRYAALYRYQLGTA